MAARVIAVAFSGGRDSAALLHATAVTARALGLHVLALHVDHGLQPEADAWVGHGASFCARLAGEGLPVDFQVHHVKSAPPPGSSVEAWAREVRYQALSRMAHAAGADLLLLGHHRKDQAETFLLQALRGGGVAGLASMPKKQVRDGICWARPWLDRPRSDIEAYVQRHQLPWVEDPSNGSPRHARNRLRQAVWPVLAEAFPEAEQSLARAAAWAQEAADLISEVAAQDVQACAHQGKVNVDALLTLSPARRSAAFRHWLAANLGHPAPAQLVQRLLTGGELARAHSGAIWPLWKGALQLYRGHLSWVPCLDQAAEPGRPAGPPAAEVHIAVATLGEHPIPSWRGDLVVSAAQSGSIAATALANLSLRARSGGEQFQTHLHSIPRSLKKQYQSSAVPEWERDRGPLVFSGERLLYVPGLGIDARALAEEGEPQLSLQWRPW